MHKQTEHFTSVNLIPGSSILDNYYQKRCLHNPGFTGAGRLRLVYGFSSNKGRVTKIIVIFVGTVPLFYFPRRTQMLPTLSQHWPNTCNRLHTSPFTPSFVGG
jgi:hypothetical protein